MGRISVAVLLIVGFAVAAFTAHRQEWPDAATVFLHLTEITAAAVIGLVIGERSASREA